MNLRSLALSLIFMLILLMVPVADAQDAPAQISAAIADLGERLGRTLALQDLDQWRYAENWYTDTALGCGLVTGEPRPEGLLGYAFSLTYQGVTYEYRVSADRSIVIPCDAQLLAITLAPIPTNVPCPLDYQGFLPPRLLGATQARVVEGGAPVRLRAEPLTTAEQINTISPGQTVQILGGPSCAEGYIWYRVSFNGQIGWVAEGALPDDYFLEGLDIADVAGAEVGPTASATAIPATPISLEPLEEGAVTTDGLPEMAGITDGALSFYDITGADVSGAAVVTGMTLGGPSVSDMTWSPDGRTLAYILLDEDFTFDLYGLPVDGVPVLLASDLFTAMPVAFNLDGAQVIYARQGQGEAGPHAVPANVFIQGLEPGSVPNLVATFPFGVGCGGGSSFPGDAIYSAEAGFGGRDLVLEMTPFGLVHSTNCTGSGTALLNLQTGESVELSVNLSRVDVNAEGTRLVGISDEQMGFGSGPLAVVDLATLTVTTLATVAPPDQVAWGPEGDIFYSTRIPGQVVLAGSETLEGLEAIGLAGGLPINEVAIHRVDLDATTDARIFEGAAYAIGRLFAPTNSDALYFSVVPNGEALVEAAQMGSVDLAGGDWNDLLAFFLPSLYRLSFDDGQVDVVIPEILQATPNEVAFAEG